MASGVKGVKGVKELNEWTGVAMLCCHGKSSSYIPTSKVIRSFQVFVHITKIFNAFWSSILKEMLIYIF